MQTDNHLKEIVKQKYSEIALQDKGTNQSSCCGAGGCSTEVYNIMTDDYSDLKGYNPDADLGLGCGLPTQFAKIKKGDTVIDQGSVIKEIYRVLKPGRHFSISDIVLIGTLPDALREDAEMYAGCVSGAIQKETYLRLIEQTGFKNITLQKEKPITIPDDIFRKYMNEKELTEFKNGKTGIFSVTVYAEKPVEEKAACCGPDCCN